MLVERGTVQPERLQIIRVPAVLVLRMTGEVTAHPAFRLGGEGQPEVPVDLANGSDGIAQELVRADGEEALGGAAAPNAHGTREALGPRLHDLAADLGEVERIGEGGLQTEC